VKTNVHSTNSPNYRLVYDLLSKDINKKVENTYKKLLEMFYNVDGDGNPTTELREELNGFKGRNWVLNFHRETSLGVRDHPTYSKLSPIGYSFDISDPEQVHKAIVTLLFYTLLNPRCFGIIFVEGNKDNQFLYYDAYGLYSEDYFMASEHDESSKIGGSHLWNRYAPGSFFTKEEYQKFIDEIRNNQEKYLNPRDIRNFLAMQPSRQSGDADIKYYIMNDFIDFFSRFYGNDFYKIRGKHDIIEDLFI